MWLIDRMKNTGSTIWSATKKIIAPTIISVGRMITSTGQSLFIVPKFIKYLTGQDNHPAGLYASIATISTTIILNLVTRIPNIFFTFNATATDSTNNHSSDLPQDESNNATQIPPENIAPYKLGWFGNTIYAGLGSFCYLSSFYSLMGAYLSVMTFYESLCEQMLDLSPDEMHEGNNEIVIQIAAAATAVAALGSVITFAIMNGVQHAKKTAETIEKRAFPNNRYVYATLGLGFVGNVTVPFTVFFSTYYALEKMPGSSHLNEDAKYTISAVGSAAITINSVFTLLPALYKVMTEHNMPPTYTESICWETPGKIIAYSAGVGDFGATAISNYTGLVLTSKQVFNIDEKEPALIAVSVFFSSTGALLNYFFAVHDGYKRTINDYHKYRNDTEYKAAISDIEDNVYEEIASEDIYASPSSPVLFNHPSRDTNRHVAPVTLIISSPKSH